MKQKPILGKHSYGNISIRSGCFDPQPIVKVGNFCSIAGGCRALLGCDHNKNLITTFPFDNLWEYGKRISVTTKGDIIIGNDVWIGENVTLLSGTTIGDGCIIGAHSVIGKNIEPYSVAVGNPVRVVSKRFTDDQITKLLSIKWWEWPDDKIKLNLKHLMSYNIDNFIKIFT